MSSTNQEAVLSHDTILTPDLIAQIHAELDKIKRVDKNGNLIMTMESLGLAGDIRYAVMGGVPGLCRMDIVMVGANKDNQEARNWIKYNLNEGGEKLTDFKFKGRGQQMTELLTVDQAIGVLERLPGPNGKRISDHIRKLGRRVAAGDQRLHDEIDANAMNQSDVNVMARVATVLEAAAEGVVLTNTPTPCTLADLAAFETRIINKMKKTDESVRRKQLYDDRRNYKRKLEEQELEVVLYERKNKSDIEKAKAITQEAIAKEQAITQEVIVKEQAITKEVLIKEEAASKTIQLKIELLKLTNNVTPEPPTGITIADVATKHNLLLGLEHIASFVLSQAGKMIKKDPFNLMPYDTPAIGVDHNKNSISVNQYNPNYEDKIVTTIKTAIYNYKRSNPTKVSNGTPTISSLFSSVPVAAVSSIPTAIEHTQGSSGASTNTRSITINIQK